MIFISLMHHPVYDRRGNIQTSSITTFDIHDLARSSTTYGVERLYLVHPSPLQRQVAGRILGFWEVGCGKEWNPFRSQALEVTRVTANLDLAIEDKLIQKSGAWFSYNGERMGQGRENAKLFLRDHPEVAREIHDRIVAIVNPPEPARDAPAALSAAAAEEPAENGKGRAKAKS